ncbi:MAG: acyl-CoA dehydrogenase family protein, partial [Myxococcota bacterium]
MNFGFSEEQELLRAQVRKLLDERSPLPEVRRVAETPEGYSRELWKELAELGWLGLIVPERFGGAGLDWIDWVVLLEETGRSLFPSPLISNTLAAVALLEGGSPAQQRRWLPRLVDGSAIGTLALLEESDEPAPSGVALRAESAGEGFVLRGAKRFVPETGRADLFVVAFRAGDAPSGCTLALVEAGAPGVASEVVRTIDETQRSGTLRLEGVQVGP